jgi:serine/threonine-protein kinase RsbW
MFLAMEPRRRASAMTDPPNLCLQLTSKSEMVSIVREALAGLAEAMGVADAALLTDIKTAVSEACNNVVLHAYEDGHAGSLEVDMRTAGELLSIVVRDRGGGIHRRSTAGDDEIVQGIGLMIIQTLTRSARISGTAGEGTEVSMEFDVPGARSIGAGQTMRLTSALGSASPSAMLLSVAPSSLAGPVLARIVGVLAVHARLSVDRLADAQLVVDALCANVAGVQADDAPLGVRMYPAEHALELTFGPLRCGCAQALVDSTGVEGLGPLIHRLTDDLAIDPIEHGEALTLVIRDSQRRAAREATSAVD